MNTLEINIIPLPSILVEKENLTIASVNKKYLELLDPNAETCIGKKVKTIISHTILKAGDYKGISLKITGGISRKADLTVQEVSENDKDFLILTFSETRLSYRKDFHNILESFSEGIVITDRNLNVVDINSAFTNLTGLSKKDVTGENGLSLVKKLLSPGALKKAQKEYYSHPGRDSSAKFELEFRGKTFSVSVTVKEDAKYCIATLNDITENKQLIESLKKSEKKFREFTNLLPEIVFEVDADLNVLYVNKALEEKTGLTQEDFSEKNLSLINLLDKSERPRLLNSIRKNMSGERVSGNVYKFFHNGETRFLQIFSSLDYEENRIVGIRGIAIDITDKKNFEEQLKESEAKLNSIVQGSENTIFTINGQMEITFINKAGIRLLGYPESEIINQKFTKVLDKESLELVTSSFKKRQAGDKIPSRYRFNIVRKDGTKRRVEINASVITNKAGQPETVANLIDITKEDEIQNAAMEAQKRLSSFFNANRDMMFIKDKQRRYLELNDRFCKFFNKEKKEIIGKTDEEIALEEKIKPCPSSDMRVLKEKELITLEEKLGNRTYSVTKFPIVFNNDILIGGIFHDITPRLKAEEELYMKEDAINASINAIVITDLEGTLIYVNDATLKLWNYRREEILGQPLEKFCSCNGALNSMKTLKEKGYSFGEDKAQRTDGSEFDVQYSITLVKDKSGTPRNIFASFIDVSERVCVEKELIESEKQYKSLFETTGTATIVYDKHKTILKCNTKFEELYGMPREKIINKVKWPDFVHPDELPRMLEYHKNRPLGISPSSYEFKFIDACGKTKTVFHTVALIESTQDRISSFIDISERKKYELIQKVVLNISRIANANIHLKEFLGQIHLEIQKVLKATNFYISLYDEKTGMYTFPYHEDEMENYESDTPQALDQSLTDFVRRKGKGYLIKEEDERELQKAKIVSLIGEPTPVWMGAPLIDASNKKTIGVIALQDYQDKNAYNKDDLVTLEIIAGYIGQFIERVKGIEALKEAKEKAEESDRLKLAFLANMSHEIRTPMNGILGFTDLLKESDFSLTEKEYFINAIQKSGNRMLNTVNDIIEISKIEAGEISIKNKIININEKISEIVSFFKLDATGKGLDLQMNLPATDSEVFLETDESKLESIITNLVKNAIKYSESGVIEFGYKPMGNRIQFYCRDEGIGISTNHLKAIFNRFEQGGISEKHAFQGSGLGLAITKANIEMLGGKIWVESEEGAGSVFYFELPF